MIDDVKSKLESEFEKVKQTIEKPNVLLIGGTGVGKSSLLNLCFGESFSQTGVGNPVTQFMQKYTKPSVPVVIYDSKGYEIGSSQESDFMNDVIKFCVTPSSNIANKIHLAWYCIQASSARITDFDINVINQIRAAKIPIAIILTKADLISDEDAIEFRKAISKELPNVQIFETSTSVSLKGLQLNELIKWSIEQLPQALQTAFVAAQRLNLEEKRKKAKEIITQHTTGAATVGFSPIPCSDAPVLLANQYALAARIMYLYSLQGLEDKFGLVLKTTMANILPMLGKYLASQLLKLIPIVGTIAGGMINAAVASSITYAFGYAISETCAKLYELMLEKGLDGMGDFLDNQFNDYFTKTFDEVLKQKNSN